MSELFPFFLLEGISSSCVLGSGRGADKQACRGPCNCKRGDAGSWIIPILLLLHLYVGDKCLKNCSVTWCITGSLKTDKGGELGF